MSKTSNYDAAVAKILAETKPGERVCALTGEKWNMTEEEIGWYKKFNVPPSKYSPMTRWKILGAFTIGSQIWYQKHPETGKPFVSSIHPASGIIGLPDKEWYAKDFSHLFLEPDFEKNFFDYFGQLIYRVPVPAERSVVPAINSLALVSFGCEDSYFVLACKCKRTFFALASTDVEDAAEIASSEFVANSYNVLHSKRIFNGKFVRESYDCNNCTFIFDCRNCEFCFGAANQRNKKYLFFNEQLTKEEWEKKVAAIDLGDRFVMDENCRKFETLINESIWPENFNERTTDCSGEYLADSTRMKNCYLCRKNSDNEFWCTFTHFAGTNNAFCFGSAATSDSYYSIVGNASWCKFCEEARQCLNCEYMLESVNCHHSYRCERCIDNYSSLVGFEFRNAAFSAWYGWGSNSYNCCDLVNVDNVKFCFRVWYSTNLEYCTDCMNCENCFGCIGLQRKKFHIFNVPYSETEYWQKLDEIKNVMLERGEYGEYLPADFSAIGFQFSMGDALFSYSDKELEQFGAPLFDPRKGAMVVEGKTDVLAEFTTADIPKDSFDPAVETIVGKPISDGVLNRSFVITSTELELYRRLNLPLPHEHFLTRLKKLMSFSNLPITGTASCFRCQNPIITYKNDFFSERSVCCRNCYLRYLEEKN